MRPKASDRSTAGPGGALKRPHGTAVLRSDAFGRVDESPPDAVDLVTGIVTDARFRGDRFELTLCTDPGDFDLLVRDPEPAAVGDRLVYVVDPAKMADLGRP